MDTSGGNVLRIIAHGMFKRKLTRSISQKNPISWEKRRPIGPKGTNNRVLDPQKSY